MRLSALSSRAPTGVLVFSACASLVAVGTWLAVGRTVEDACALPDGAAKLAPEAQAEIARHAMSCRDLEHGRITRDDYRRLIGAVAAPAATPNRIQWASSVRAVSSEYSPSSWSAQQVLGPPDVFPASGDNPHAWASRDADAQTEFIEVGFAQPTSLRELQIFETFNPGAISSLETISVSGHHAIYYPCGAGELSLNPCAVDQPAPRPTGSQMSHVPLACGEPIAAVRVTLASGAVPGWNELDAIGGVPCM